MMHRLATAVLIGTALLSVVSAQGELSQGLERALEEFRSERGIPGATVAVIMPDGEVVAAAAGLADVEAERAMKVTDRMMSGSVGKMLFAAAILLAVEDGELDLDEVVSRWLGEEEWFGRLANSEELTLRVLMRHRSGIREHVRAEGFMAACREDPDRVWEAEELVGYVLDREPLFDCDTAFAYADTNYIVAGMVYERATGRRIYDAVRERILVPLELTDTVPSDRRVIPGLVPGYGAESSPFGLVGKLIDEDGKFAINPQMEWTGGGFALTTTDLARFARALFGGRVVGEESLEAMLEVRPAPGLGAYGLGVIAAPSELGPTFGHSGWFPGYLCQVTHYPEAGITVALQVNTDDFRKVGPLRRAVDRIAVAVSEIRVP